MPYIVGCFVVFGAFGIWKFAVDTGNNMESDIEKNVEQSASIEEKNENKEPEIKCEACNKILGIGDTVYNVNGKYYCSTCNNSDDAITEHVSSSGAVHGGTSERF